MPVKSATVTNKRSTRTRHTSGGNTSAEAKSQTQVAINAAHQWFELWGIEMSPSRVSTLVRRFEKQATRNDSTLFDYLEKAVRLSVERRQDKPENIRVITYADPTGETAAKNVDRTKRQAA